MSTQKVIDFCAYECWKQQSGELSVARMCRAYAYAQYAILGLNVEHLLVLARTVEPVLNAQGYRLIPVGFADGSLALDYSLVPRAMLNLLDEQTALTPEEFYQEFETIHPFVDGNGRLGAILYNYLRSSLDNPVEPPKYKFAGETS